MKVLLTGASGFLGRHLLDAAPPAAHILAQSRRALSLPAIQALPFDLTSENWQSHLPTDVDVVIHTAAESNPNRCEQHPAIAEAINYQATIRLADFARDIGARFIFTATDLIFDGEKGNYNELDKPAPVNFYGKTKLRAEEYLLRNHPDAVSIRCALIFGKPHDDRMTFSGQVVEQLQTGQPVNLFTDEYRTPVLVNDLAAAIWELSELDFSGPLNIGGSQRLSRYEMGEIVCRRLNLPTDLLQAKLTTDVTLPAKRPRDCSMDISRAQELLKTPLRSYESGIAVVLGLV